MARRKLTAMFVDKVSPPVAGQVEYYDELLPGFGLRVSYKGAKAWFLMGRLRGTQKRITLGRYPTLTLLEAREKARETCLELSKGLDPGVLVAQRMNKLSLIEKETFGSQTDEFLKKYVIPKLRTRMLEGYVFALKGKYTNSWTAIPVSALGKGQILDLIEGLEAEGKHAMARQILAYLHKFFSWCVARDILVVNPCSHVKVSVTQKPRERVLSLSELQRVLDAAGKLGGPGGGLVMLLLLTGQRRGKTSAMRWQDLEGLDSANPIWRIPSSITKNKRPHSVHLSERAIQVIRAQNRRLDCQFVFSNAGKQLSDFSGIKSAVEAKLALVSGSLSEPWTVHDLRRSLVTGMNEMGIAPPHVIEAIVNHVSGHRSGIAGVYNRATYAAERARALQEWATYVSGAGASNVAQLRLAS